MDSHFWGAGIVNIIYVSYYALIYFSQKFILEVRRRQVPLEFLTALENRLDQSDTVRLKLDFQPQNAPVFVIERTSEERENLAPLEFANHPSRALFKYYDVAKFSQTWADLTAKLKDGKTLNLRITRAGAEKVLAPGTKDQKISGSYVEVALVQLLRYSHSRILFRSSRKQFLLVAFDRDRARISGPHPEPGRRRRLAAMSS